MARDEIMLEENKQKSPLDASATPSSSNDVAKGPWKPSPRIYIVIGALMVIILAAALDATALSVALPVSISKPFFGADEVNLYPDYGTEARGNSN